MNARHEMTFVMPNVLIAFCVAIIGCSNDSKSPSNSPDTTVSPDETQDELPEPQQPTPSPPEDLSSTSTEPDTARQPATAAAGDWVSLLDGSDLSAWAEFPVSSAAENGAESPAVSEKWLIRDGVLVCNSSSHGWLSSVKAYTDFELEFECKLPEKANSGLHIRHAGKGPLTKSGLEIQIIEESTWGSPLKPTQRTGAIWNLVGPNQSVQRPVGQWNSMQVHCVGEVVQVTLNGTMVADVTIAKENGTPLGYLVISNWQGQAKGSEFRNIRVRELAP